MRKRWIALLLACIVAVFGVLPASAVAGKRQKIPATVEVTYDFFQQRYEGVVEAREPCQVFRRVTVFQRGGGQIPSGARGGEGPIPTGPPTAVGKDRTNRQGVFAIRAFQDPFSTFFARVESRVTPKIRCQWTQSEDVTPSFPDK